MANLKDYSPAWRRFQMLLHLNIIKSVRINIHYFPFLIAIKLPILLFGKVDIKDCIHEKMSEILLSKVRTGILRIGLKDCWANGVVCDRISYIKIKGKLVLGDSLIIIGNGCRLVVEKGGILSIMGDVWINRDCRIYCESDIYIGKGTEFSWECQIYDTNFHYMLESNGRIRKMTGNIHIGSECWIGNRVTISKGTYLPDKFIVASNSLVNKSFNDDASKGCIVGGIPAAILSNGYSRVWDQLLVEKLDAYFAQHPERDYVDMIDVK